MRVPAMAVVLLGLAALLSNAPVLAGDMAFGFAVDLTLSPKAAALLKARHEGIVVSAMYSGDPLPAWTRKADEEGMIDLGNEIVTVAGVAGRATITGNKVLRAHLAWAKNIQVLINVYSARRSSQDNLLDCGIFEDTVAKAQARPIAISCKLIGEK